MEKKRKGTEKETAFSANGSKKEQVTASHMLL